MVEDSKEYALRWAGHSGYVTERFSSLFARQALVDVTLICEEQKLRVHKLVLASNSIYFEEILQQDLGQEPIIFLKDLSFEILKAMVEFMYCGETTISHECLPSLLNAAKIFKVKELAHLIDPIMDNEVIVKDFDSDVKNEKTENQKSKLASDLFNENESTYVAYNKMDKEGCSLICSESDEIVNTNENRSLDDNLIINSDEDEIEHTLYEEPDEEISRNVNESLSSIKIDNEERNHCTTPYCTVNDTTSQIHPENFVKNVDLKPIIYEQCCDLTNESNKRNTTFTESCRPREDEDDRVEAFVENVDVPEKVGKCTKVYTHKRQKSMDELKNKLTDVNDLTILPKTSSTDNIDLLDEPSSNDIPTLLTSLDIESAEYILSLSTENIQSIVGGTFTEQLSLIGQRETDLQSVARNKSDSLNNNNNNNRNVDAVRAKRDNSQEKEFFLRNNENHAQCDSNKPVLRRSMRLHQHENDEHAYSNNNNGNNNTNNNNTNNNITQYGNKEKQFKKMISSNRTETLIKKKRKIRDMDRKVSDQSNNGNNIPRMQSVKRNLSSTRKNARLIVKKNAKSKSPSPTKEKEYQKSKMNKEKCEIRENMDGTNISIVLSNELNTVENINRALWGDMSDVLEYDQHTLNMPEYILDREIPFAVGLLPLRTALERMQATLDYQPRKTRSSVASIRHDLNHLKRKSFVPIDTNVNTKKPNIENGDLETNTVCHIQISTASPYVKNRKKFLAGHIAALESTAVINRQ